MLTDNLPVLVLVDNKSTCAENWLTFVTLPTKPSAVTPYLI